MSDMVKLNNKEKEEFNQWLNGNTGQCWVLNDEVFESKYINEVVPIAEINGNMFLVELGGEYCRLSYM